MNRLPELLKGKRIVLKLSGKVVDNEDILRRFMAEVCEIHSHGAIVWIVHGGGKQIDKELAAKGVKPVFVNGLRVTDSDTLEVVRIVLDSVRKKVVGVINEVCGNAIVSEVNGYVVLAKRKSPEYGLVGEPVGIDSGPIAQYLNGKIVVVTSLGHETGSTQVLNINADDAALQIAKFLKADRLIFVSDVPGVLLNPQDKSSIIKKIDHKIAEELITQGIITKGMIPKIRSSVAAAKIIGAVCIIDDSIGIMKSLKEEGGTTIVF